MSAPPHNFPQWSAADLEWRFIADGVMGGVSRGAAEIEEGAIRLRGTVSTENNGGFLQVRTELPDGLPGGARGLRAEVRGNGERYFLHVRTIHSARPWLFHQAGFGTGADWAHVELPFAEFEARRGIAAPIRPGEVRSVALAAYGRDHVADVALRSLAVV